MVWESHQFVLLTSKQIFQQDEWLGNWALRILPVVPRTRKKRGENHSRIAFVGKTFKNSMTFRSIHHPRYWRQEINSSRPWGASSWLFSLLVDPSLCYLSPLFIVSYGTWHLLCAQILCGTSAFFLLFQAKVDLLLVGDVTVQYLADIAQKSFSSIAEVTITIRDVGQAAMLLKDLPFDVVFLKMTSLPTAEELGAMKLIRWSSNTLTFYLYNSFYWNPFL